MSKEDILDLTEPIEQKGPRLLVVREGENRKQRRRKQALARKTRARYKTAERRRKRSMELIAKNEALRDVLIGYRKKGMSFVDISEKMNLKESTVRNILKGDTK